MVICYSSNRKLIHPVIQIFFWTQNLWIQCAYTLRFSNFTPENLWSALDCRCGAELSARMVIVQNNLTRNDPNVHREEMDKSSVVCSYNGILYNCENECIIVTHKHMQEFHNAMIKERNKSQRKTYSSIRLYKAQT